MFDPSLLGKYFTNEIPSNIPNTKFCLRPLQVTDYDKGFCDTLSQLSSVGPLTRQEFIEIFEYWKSSGMYYNVVIEESIKGRIVAVGTLLVERKLLHLGGSIDIFI